MGDLVERLRKQITEDEERGKQGHPDPDYGAHNEAHPENLIMCILDHGPNGQEVFTELCSCGYSIVPTATISELADALEAAERERDRFKAALIKIASWDVFFPERADRYGSMALVTAREAVTESAYRDWLSQHGDEWVRERAAKISWTRMPDGWPERHALEDDIATALREAEERGKAEGYAAGHNAPNWMLQSAATEAEERLLARLREPDEEMVEELQLHFHGYAPEDVEHFLSTLAAVLDKRGDE